MHASDKKGGGRGLSGRYVLHPDGYRSFIPDSLPPADSIDPDHTLLCLLSDADRALGRLAGISGLLPNPEMLVMMFVKKEAVLSSQIEGTQASLLDVLEYEAGKLSGADPRDLGAVVNYIAAMDLGLKQVEKGVPVGAKLIREVHGKLMKGVRGGDRRPGELRDVQNWIGPPDCDIGDALFIPPSVKDMKKAMAQLESYIQSGDTLPPLLRAGLVHAQFETIHPFLDGNGRVGRLLITLMLIKEGHLPRPLLYLSHFFKQNRQEYYDRLQAVRDDSDWVGWLRFFLRGVRTVSVDAYTTSGKILALREEHRTMLMKEMGRKSGSPLILLDALYDNPITTIRGIASVTGISYQNSNILAARLTELGILREVTGNRRNRLFEYTRYADIFDIR